MKEWKIVGEQPVELGTDPRLVEEAILDLLLGHKLDPPNVMVHILSPRGMLLSVGIADDRAFMQFSDGNDDPFPQMVVDPHPRPEDAATALIFHGERSEVSNRYCVPIDYMKHVLKEFVRTEEIPDWAVVEGS
jgi:hypothetical protein